MFVIGMVVSFSGCSVKIVAATSSLSPRCCCSSCPLCTRRPDTRPLAAGLADRARDLRLHLPRCSPVSPEHHDELRHFSGARCAGSWPTGSKIEPRPASSPRDEQAVRELPQLRNYLFVALGALGGRRLQVRVVERPSAGSG